MAASGMEGQPRPSAVIRLDLRSLPAPEPLIQALAAVDTLQPGQALEVLTPLLPGPLLTVLDARGLRWRSEACVEGGVWVGILCPAS